MPAEHLEHLADEAFGRPVRHADLAAAPADAEHLAGRLELVGREHHAEGRDHGVERAALEGKLLGVGDLEVDVQAFRVGPGAAALEQGLDVVGRGDVAPAAREGERRIAVAGGHVEHLGVGGEVQGLGQVLADDLQGGADPGIVAGGPGGILLGLDGRVVGGRSKRGEGRHGELL